MSVADVYSLRSNFTFHSDPSNLTNMNSVVKGLGEIQAAVKKTSQAVSRTDIPQAMGAGFKQASAQTNTARNGIVGVGDSLKKIRKEFAALKAESKNIDFGGIDNPRIFKRSIVASNKFVKEIKALRSQITGTSADERILTETLKRQEAVMQRQIKLQKAQRAAGDTAARVGQFSALKSTSSAALAPMIQQGREALRVFSDFEEKMSGVSAITGASGEDFDVLRKKALALGSSTRYTSAQAAEAMQYLGMAGFKAGQIMGGVGATLDLATAGALDLGTAADISSNVLSGFKLQISELSHVADVLAVTASNANTSVQQMGVAMSYAAPSAKLYGATIEETSALIGVMSNAGIQGDKAGTAARKTFLSLAAPTSAGSKALQEMGVSLTDTQGNLRSVIDVFNEMSAKLNIDPAALDLLKGASEETEDSLNKLGDVSQSKKIKQLKDIFGTTAVSGVAAAMGQIQELNRLSLNNMGASVNIDVLKEYIEQTQGIKVKKGGNLFSALLDAAPNYQSAAEMIEQATINITRADLKSLRPKELEALREYFTNEKGMSIGSGQDLFEAIARSSGSSTEAIGNLRSAMESLNITVDNSNGAARTMALTMADNLIGSFRGFESALEGLRIAYLDPMIPFLRLLLDAGTNVLHFLTNLPSPIRVIASAVLGSVVAFTALLAVIGAAGATLFSFAQAEATVTAASLAMSASSIPLTGFFTESMGAFRGTNPITKALTGSATSAEEFGLAFGGVTKETLGELGALGKGFQRFSLSVAKSGLAFAVSPWGLAIIGFTALNTILSQIIPGFNLLGTILSAIAAPLGFIVGLVSGLVKGLFKVTVSIESGLLSPVFAALNSIGDAVKMAANNFMIFSAKGEEMGEAIADSILDVVEFVKSKVQSAWDKTIDFIRKPLEPLARFVQWVGDIIVHALAENSPGLTETIRWAWDKTYKFLAGIFTKIVGWGIKLEQALFNLGNWKAAAQFLVKTLATVGSLLSVLNKAFLGFGDISSEEQQAARQQIFDGVIEGILSVARIVPLLTGVWKGIQSAEREIIRSFLESLDAIGASLLIVSSIPMNLAKNLRPGAESIVSFLEWFTKQGIPRALMFSLPAGVAASISFGLLDSFERGIIDFVHKLPGLFEGIASQLVSMVPPEIAQQITFLGPLEELPKKGKEALTSFGSYLEGVRSTAMGLGDAIAESIAPLLAFKLTDVIGPVAPILLALIGHFTGIAQLVQLGVSSYTPLIPMFGVILPLQRAIFEELPKSPALRSTLEYLSKTVLPAIVGSLKVIYGLQLWILSSFTITPIVAAFTFVTRAVRSTVKKSRSFLAVLYDAAIATMRAIAATVGATLRQYVSSIWQSIISATERIPYIGKFLAKQLQVVGNLISKVFLVYIELIQKSFAALGIGKLLDVWVKVFADAGKGIAIGFKKGITPIFDMMKFFLGGGYLKLYYETGAFAKILKDGFFSGVKLDFVSRYFKGIVGLAKLAGGEIVDVAFPLEPLRVKSIEAAKILAMSGTEIRKLASNRLDSDQITKILGKNFEIKLARFVLLMNPVGQVVREAAMFMLFWYSILKPLNKEFFTTLANTELFGVRLNYLAGFIEVVRFVFVSTVDTFMYLAKAMPGWIMSILRAFDVAGRAAQAFSFTVLKALQAMYAILKFPVAAMGFALIAPIDYGLKALRFSLQLLRDQTQMIGDALRGIVNGDIRPLLHLLNVDLTAIIRLLMWPIDQTFGRALRIIGFLAIETVKELWRFRHPLKEIARIAAGITGFVSHALSEISAAIHRVTDAVWKARVTILQVGVAIAALAPIVGPLLGLFQFNPIFLVLEAIIGLIWDATHGFKILDGVIQALSNPIQFLDNILSGFKGLIESAVPDSVVNFVSGFIGLVIKNIPLIIAGIILISKIMGDKISATVVKITDKFGAMFNGILKIGDAIGGVAHKLEKLTSGDRGTIIKGKIAHAVRSKEYVAGSFRNPLAYSQDPDLHARATKTMGEGLQKAEAAAKYNRIASPKKLQKDAEREMLRQARYGSQDDKDHLMGTKLVRSDGEAVDKMPLVEKKKNKWGRETYELTEQGKKAARNNPARYAGEKAREDQARRVQKAGIVTAFGGPPSEDQMDRLNTARTQNKSIALEILREFIDAISGLHIDKIFVTNADFGVPQFAGIDSLPVSAKAFDVNYEEHVRRVKEGGDTPNAQLRDPQDRGNMADFHLQYKEQTARSIKSDIFDEVRGFQSSNPNPEMKARLKEIHRLIDQARIDPSDPRSKLDTNSPAYKKMLTEVAQMRATHYQTLNEKSDYGYSTKQGFADFTEANKQHPSEVDRVTTGGAVVPEALNNLANSLTGSRGSFMKTLWEKTGIGEAVKTFKANQLERKQSAIRQTVLDRMSTSGKREAEDGRRGRRRGLERWMAGRGMEDFEGPKGRRLGYALEGAQINNSELASRQEKNQRAYLSSALARGGKPTRTVGKGEKDDLKERIKRFDDKYEGDVDQMKDLFNHKAMKGRGQNIINRVLKGEAVSEADTKAYEQSLKSAGNNFKHYTLDFFAQIATNINDQTTQHGRTNDNALMDLKRYLNAVGNQITATDEEMMELASKLGISVSELKDFSKIRAKTNKLSFAYQSFQDDIVATGRRLDDSITLGIQRLKIMGAGIPFLPEGFVDNLIEKNIENPYKSLREKIANRYKNALTKTNASINSVQAWYNNLNVVKSARLPDLGRAYEESKANNLSSLMGKREEYKGKSVTSEMQRSKVAEIPAALYRAGIKSNQERLEIMQIITKGAQGDKTVADLLRAKGIEVKKVVEALNAIDIVEDAERDILNNKKFSTKFAYPFQVFFLKQLPKIAIAALKDLKTLPGMIWKGAKAAQKFFVNTVLGTARNSILAIASTIKGAGAGFSGLANVLGDRLYQANTVLIRLFGANFLTPFLDDAAIKLKQAGRAAKKWTSGFSAMVHKILEEPWTAERVGNYIKAIASKVGTFFGAIIDGVNTLSQKVANTGAWAKISGAFGRMFGSVSKAVNGLLNAVVPGRKKKQQARVARESTAQEVRTQRSAVKNKRQAAYNYPLNWSNKSEVERFKADRKSYNESQSALAKAREAAKAARQKDRELNPRPKSMSDRLGQAAKSVKKFAQGRKTAAQEKGIAHASRKLPQTNTRTGEVSGVQISTGHETYASKAQSKINALLSGISTKVAETLDHAAKETKGIWRKTAAEFDANSTKGIVTSLSRLPRISLDVGKKVASALGGPAASKVKAIWSDTADHVTGNSFQKLIKRAYKTGRAILHNLAENSPGTTEEVRNRYDETTQHVNKDMDQMANHAQVTGEEIQQHLVGAGDRIEGEFDQMAAASAQANQEMQQDATTTGGRLKRIFGQAMSSIGGIGRTGMAIGGAVSAAGMAAQTVAFSLTSLGVLNEEQSQMVMKFSEIFTILGAIGGLGAPIIGLFTTGGTTLLSIAGVLGTSITGIGGALAGVMGMGSVAFAPILLGIGAVVLAVAGLYFAFKHNFLGISSIAKSIGGMLAHSLTYPVEWIKGAWVNLVPGILSTFGGWVNGAIELGKNLIGALNCHPTDRIKEAWQGVGDFFHGVLSTFLAPAEFVGNALSGVFGGVFGIVGNAAKGIGGLFNSGKNAVAGGVNTIKTTSANVVHGGASFVGQKVSDVKSSVGSTIDQIVTPILFIATEIDKINTLLDRQLELSQKQLNAFQLQFASGIIGALTNKERNAGIYGAIKNAPMTGGAMKGIASSGLGKFLVKLGGEKGLIGLLSKLGTVVMGITGIGAGPFAAIAVGLSSIVAAVAAVVYVWETDFLGIRSKIEGFGAAIVHFLTSPIRVIQAAWNGFVGFFQSLPLVGDAIRMGMGLIAALNCHPTVRVTEAWQGVGSSILGIFGGIGSAAKGLGGFLGSALASPFKLLGEGKKTINVSAKSSSETILLNILSTLQATHKTLSQLTDVMAPDEVATTPADKRIRQTGAVSHLLKGRKGRFQELFRQSVETRRDEVERTMKERMNSSSATAKLEYGQYFDKSGILNQAGRAFIEQEIASEHKTKTGIFSKEAQDKIIAKVNKNPILNLLGRPKANEDAERWKEEEISKNKFLHAAIANEKKETQTESYLHQAVDYLGEILSIMSGGTKGGKAVVQSDILPYEKEQHGLGLGISGGKEIQRSIDITKTGISMLQKAPADLAQGLESALQGAGSLLAGDFSGGKNLILSSLAQLKTGIGEGFVGADLVVGGLDLGIHGTLDAVTGSMEFLNTASTFAQQKWQQTTGAISGFIGRLVGQAPEQGYELQKAISEGSPGPTYWIRKHWANTAESVKNNMLDMAESSHLFGGVIGRVLSDVSYQASYLSKTNGKHMEALFAPGAELVRSSLKRLGADTVDFGKRAAVAIATLNFGELIQATKDFGGNFKFAAGGVIAGLGQMAIAAMATASFFLGPFAPVLLIIGGIALAAAAIFANFLGIRSILKVVLTIGIGLGEVLWGTLKGIISTLKGTGQILKAIATGDMNLFRAGVANLKAGVESFKEGLKRGANRILGLFGTNLDVVGQKLSRLIAFLSDGERVGQFVTERLIGLGRSAVNMVGTLSKKAIAGLETLRVTVARFIYGAWENIQSLWGKIRTLSLADLFAFFKREGAGGTNEVLLAIKTAIFNWVQGLPSELRNPFTGVFNWFSGFGRGVMKTLADEFGSDFIEQLKGQISRLRQFLTNAWQSVRSVLNLEDMAPAVAQQFERVKAIATGAFAWMKQQVSELAAQFNLNDIPASVEAVRVKVFRSFYSLVEQVQKLWAGLSGGMNLEGFPAKIEAIRVKVFRSFYFLVEQVQKLWAGLSGGVNFSHLLSNVEEIRVKMFRSFYSVVERVQARWEQFAQSFSTVFAPIVKFINWISNFFVSRLAHNSPGPIPWILEKWQVGVKKLISIFRALVESVKRISKQIVEFVGGAWDGLTSTIKVSLSAMGQPLMELFREIKQLASTLMGTIGAIASSFQSVGSGSKEVGEHLSRLPAIGERVGKVLGVSLNAAAAAIQIIARAAARVTSLLTKLVPYLEPIAKLIGRITLAGIDFGGSFVKEIISALSPLKEFFSTVGRLATEIASLVGHILKLGAAIVSGIVTPVTSILRKLGLLGKARSEVDEVVSTVSVAAGIGQRAGEVVGGAISGILGLITKLIGGVTEVVAIVNSSVDKVGAAIDAVIGRIEKLINAFKGMGQAIAAPIQSVQQGFKETTQKISGFWARTVGRVKGDVSELETHSEAEGYEIQRNLAQGSPGILVNIRRYWLEARLELGKRMDEIATDARLSGGAIEKYIGGAIAGVNPVNLERVGQAVEEVKFRSQLGANRASARLNDPTAGNTGDIPDHSAALQSSRSAMLSIGGVLSNFAPQLATPLFMLNDFIDAFIDLKALFPGVKAFFMGQAAAQSAANAAIATSELAVAGASATATTTQVVGAGASSTAAIAQGGIIGGVNAFLSTTYGILAGAAIAAWTAIAAPLAPFLPIILGIVGAIGLLALAFKTNFLWIRDGINFVVGSIKMFFGTLYTGFFSTVRYTFTSIWYSLQELRGALIYMAQAFMSPFRQLLNIFGGSGDQGLQGGISMLVNIILGPFRLAMWLLRTGVANSVRSFSLLFRIVGFVVGLLGRIAVVVNPIVWVLKIIQEAIKQTVDVVKGVFGGVVQEIGVIGKSFGAIGSSIAKPFQELFAAFGWNGEGGEGPNSFFRWISGAIIFISKSIATVLLVPLRIAAFIIGAIVKGVSLLIQGFLFVGRIISAVVLAPIRLLAGIISTIGAPLRWVMALFNKGGGQGGGNPVQKFATGGMVQGSGGTDSVPALVSPGEFVVNPRAAAQYMPMLSSINAGQDIPVPVPAPQVMPSAPPGFFNRSGTGGGGTGEFSREIVIESINITIGDINVDGGDREDIISQVTDDVRFKRRLREALREAVEMMR